MWVLFDDLARPQALYDVINTDDAKRLRFHLASCVFGEDTLRQRGKNDLVVHESVVLRYQNSTANR